MTGVGEVPATRYRHFRPQFTGVAPGVNSYVEGKDWFDGVEMHLELGVQNAVAGSGFIGAAPAFQTPSSMEVTTPAALMPQVLGVGHLHNAMTGVVFPIAGIRATDRTVRYFYWNGTTYAPVTASAPAPSGILNGLYLRISYIPTVKAAPRNFVAFGDSITRFENAAGAVGDINWTPHVPITDELVFGGGFARDGATSAVVLANAKRMSADVAVCMVGVNDIAHGVAQETTLANVLALKDKVQADKFVLCKIAPYNANAAAAASLNDAYAALASEHDMVLIDPYADYRQSCGDWVAGASGDGVHPTSIVQRAVANVIRAGIAVATAA